MLKLLKLPVMLIKLIRFLLFVLYEILIANLRVSYHVIVPGIINRPGVIAIDVNLKSPTEITWLVNIISLTPGTLILEISDDSKTIFVHDMFLDDLKDIPKIKEEIKYKFEKPIMEIFK